MRDGVLRASGNRVHPLLVRPKPVEEEKQRVDPVPVIERYTDLAAHMHRTAVAPRSNAFLIGCACGWATISLPGISSAKASMIAQQHVLDKAEKLFSQLEPKLIGEENGN